MSLMEDSFKFRPIKMAQRSGFTFPHEAEADRVKGALWLANAALMVTVFCLAPLSLVSGDAGPFMIGMVMWVIAELRWKLLDYRLHKFMQGSGL